MVESMQLFSSICNSSWFLNTAMILFMNKKDLFAEKIQRVNITTCFPDYEGGQNYDEAVNFIKVKFNELNQHPDKKTIYMHETCVCCTLFTQHSLGHRHKSSADGHFERLRHDYPEELTKGRHDVSKALLRACPTTYKMKSIDMLIRRKPFPLKLLNVYLELK
jgi:hypothetical protein